MPSLTIVLTVVRGPILGRWSRPTQARCNELTISGSNDHLDMNEIAPRRRSPAKFVILVFLLSLPFWLVGAVADEGLPLNLSLSALMFPCPLIAALVLVLREEGRDGVRTLLRRTIDHSGIRPRAWYLPTIFLMPSIYLLSFGIQHLMGWPLHELSGPFLMIPVLFLVFFITAVGEETGWMGYAADPLQGRRSALETGLILGLVWSMWHVVPDIQAGQDWAFIAGQRTFSVLLRVLIVWIYNNTGRSLFAAVLLHTMDNVSVYSLFPDSDQYVPAVTAAVTVVVVMVVTALWGPRTLARYRFGQAASESV